MSKNSEARRLILLSVGISKSNRDSYFLSARFWHTAVGLTTDFNFDGLLKSDIIESNYPLKEILAAFDRIYIKKRGLVPELDTVFKAIALTRKRKCKLDLRHLYQR